MRVSWSSEGRDVRPFDLSVGELKKSEIRCIAEGLYTMSNGRVMISNLYTNIK